ncbi:hypothetical protein KI387_027543, partial [Taxus chinensis]
IYNIFQLLPQNLRLPIFSATMPLKALETTRKFMNNPFRILVKRNKLTLQGINHFYVNVEKEQWELDTLCDLYETLALTQSVLFMNSRREVEWLIGQTIAQNYTASGTHGDMDKNKTSIIMRELLSGSTRVFITNDLLTG